MDKKNQKIVDLFNEYTILVVGGVSPEQALETFDYLHPVTLSRLKKHIKEAELDARPQLKLVK